MAKPLPVLTDEQVEEFMSAILDRHRLEKIIKRYGFTSTRQFQKYCQANPWFDADLESTKQQACRFIEDELHTVAEDYDPKAARVALEAKKALLVYNDPSRYSQKLDVNMNQTVSIRNALDTANDRVKELFGMRDVLPILGKTGSEK